MELIENLLQLLVAFVGALLSGISYRKSGRQAYFLLLCFYGCFALYIFVGKFRRKMAIGCQSALYFFRRNVHRLLRAAASQQQKAHHSN